MATVDLSYKNLNNQKRMTNASVAWLEFNLGGGVTITSGDSFITCGIPKEALITSIFTEVEVAFNAGTTAVMNIGNAGSATAYATGVNINAATSGSPISTTAGKYVDAGDTIILTPSWTGTAPTTGRVKVIFEYIETATLAGEYNTVV